MLRVTSDARLVSVARITPDGRVTSGPLVALTGVPILAVYVTGVLTLAVYVTGVLTHMATMIRWLTAPPSVAGLALVLGGNIGGCWHRGRHTDGPEPVGRNAPTYL